ncbi:hypothetical protein [Mycobacterium marinum]|uniref:hypothetical protein n=1 Tax=Mycobacterium marinum TaxID=1781 RepID=UPI0035627A6C
MTIHERCLAAANSMGNGDIAEADRLTRCDVERGWRYVIALIEEDDPAAKKIEQEIGDCPVCSVWLARCVGGFASGLMIGRFGRENAVKLVQAQLDQVLNAPDVFDSGAEPE